MDGGSLELIEQWKDELPTFKRIMEGGVFGKLESTVPPITCPAWPCMFTGKNPGQLGMYYFLDLISTRTFNSNDWHGDSVWKSLNDYGYRTGLFNIPMTYPPHKVDGFMVTGIGTPTQNNRYTYPQDLRGVLDKVTDGYIINLPVVVTQKGRDKEFKQIFFDTLRKHLKAMKYLINREDWDLFIGVFFATDGIQHYFWHRMDIIKEMYRFLDRALAKLLPQGVNLIIASDHGFTELKGCFSVNKWLEENGYLVYKKQPKQSNLYKMREYILPKVPLKMVQFIRQVVPQRLAQKLTTTGEERDRMLNMMQNINWSKSKAYCPSVSGGIFINSDDLDKYRSIREEIIGKLSQIRHPDTGEPLGLELYRREDIYHGKYRDKAPDIAIAAGGKYYHVSLGGKDLWSEPFASGMHHKQGLFIAYGPDIKNSGERLEGLRIYDITPTILHIFGLPIPKDMDGQVLSKIFKPGSKPAKRSPVYKEVEERQKIKGKISRLKTLGRI